MRERAKREQRLVDQIKGWSFSPLYDEGVTFRMVDEFRVPERFGGWWREHRQEAGGELGDPTGREVVIRMAVQAGAARVEEVTFRYFEDEFERQHVPAMRDLTLQIFSVMGESIVSGGSIAAAVRSAPGGQRDRAIQVHQRRRRKNAIPLDVVAKLYREGGAKRVAQVGVDGVSVAEATAYRWIRAARDAGVLEERS